MFLRGSLHLGCHSNTDPGQADQLALGLESVPCLSSLNSLEYIGLIVSSKNSMRRNHGTERSRLRVSMKKLPLLALCPSQPLVGQGLSECVLLLEEQVVLPSRLSETAVRGGWFLP